MVLSGGSAQVANGLILGVPLLGLIGHFRHLKA